MNGEKKSYKVSIRYQGHAVTVDLRSVIAINRPNEGDKFFRVFFSGGMVWNVGAEQHAAVYRAWCML